MSINLETDWINMNRGGTPGTPGSGVEGPAKTSSVLKASVANPASALPTGLTAFEGVVVWHTGQPYVWDGAGYKRIATFAAVNTGVIVDAGNYFTIDTVEDALQQLGGDVGDFDDLIGTAPNETDLGAFAGNTIPDGQDVKAALQALETALEALAGDWIGQAELT